MGYQDLLVYRLATTIYDGTVEFCRRFIRSSRQKDQMEQAARSGKQNIVEGSLPKSYESCLKLIGVARGSFGELLEDYKDFLRQRSLPIWKKTDARVLKVRAFRESIEKPTNLSNLANWSNLNLRKPEDFANLMICLIYKETFLVDRLLRATEENFVREGGFRENLFKKRREFKKGKLV